jgi:hypothetical protein
VDLDAELDRLYGLPLDGFTAARDALARSLREAGDAPAAAEVKQRKKPNLAAWTVNQLVRRYPDELAALVDATDGLRRAQRKVLGGAKPQALREASDERRRAAGALAKLAGGALREAGHAASPGTLAAVHDTLMALATDDAGAEDLKRGRLTRELKPQAILDVSALGVVHGQGEPPAQRPKRKDPAAIAKARTALDAAVAAAKESSARAAEAADEAASRGEEADAASEQVDALRTHLREAARAAKAAREAAEFARRAERARAHEADAAAAALEKAEVALRAADPDPDD